MIKLKKEKEFLAKEKQAKQLNLTDAPKKIKIEKKSPSKVTSLFTKKTPTEKVKIITNSEFKNWEFPSIDLLEDR
jgi:hypothetical protein